MTQIKKITNKHGADIYLRTHTKAVVDDNGYTAESRLQAMQDEINQKQLEVGAVPSDIAPTEGSTNWVTSGGVYNATNVGEPNVPIDLSEYTVVTGFISNIQNTWSTHSGECIFIPIAPNQKYRIRANLTNASYYAFMKSNEVGSPGATVSTFASGSSLVSMSPNNVFVDTAPQDATYLYISYTYNSDDREPSGVDIYKKISTREALEELLPLKEIDEVPSKNSQKLVKSGGIYSSTPSNTDNETLSDLDISDENGNILVRFKDGEIITKNFDSSKAGKPVTLRILAIGNSYTLDSFMYLPFLLKNYGLDIQIGIYYRGGASLVDQISEWSTNTSNHSFYYIDTKTDTAWNTISTKTCPKNCVDYQQWDIISIQQGSVDSVDYDNYVPEARNLIELIHNEVNYPFVLAWNININRVSSGSDYTVIAETILENIENICKREPVDIVFPYGTAIFNARTNSILNQIGDGGNLWCSDQVHLQEGLPCYIASLTNLETIFRKFYPQYSVLGERTRPTATMLTSWNIQGRNGDCTGISDTNCFLAQICAIQANNDMFNITTIY